MKKLYVPGKVWLDVNAFTREFPQTKLPLVILLGTSTKIIYNPAAFLKSLGIDQWAYDKKIETYRDIVKGALSPEFPLTIKFQANPCLTARATAGCPEGGVRFSFPIDETCSRVLGRGFVAIDAPYEWQFSARNLAWIMAYYMKEIEIKVSPLGASLENCRRVYKDRMIDDFASRGFKYFEAKSQSEYKQYNEVYA